MHVCREQEKQAKLRAKEQHKQERQQEKEGNRASKGDVSLLLCATAAPMNSVHTAFAVQKGCTSAIMLTAVFALAMMAGNTLVYCRVYDLQSSAGPANQQLISLQFGSPLQG